MLNDSQYQIILDVLAPYSPSRVGIFGSYARNEEKKDSDLDILVNFSKSISLFDLVGMEIELSEKLGIKVDLVTERAVHPKLREFINQDLKVIME